MAHIYTQFLEAYHELKRYTLMTQRSIKQITHLPRTYKDLSSIDKHLSQPKINLP